MTLTVNELFSKLNSAEVDRGMWDMGTPGSPPNKLTTVPDKWVWPSRRLADISVGPTDLVGGPHNLLKTFQKIP
jgi:hypothetical protein